MLDVARHFFGVDGRLPADRPARRLQAQRAAPAPVRRPGLAARDRRAGRGSPRTAAAARSAATPGGFYTQDDYRAIVRLRRRALRHRGAGDRHARPHARGAPRRTPSWRAGRRPSRTPARTSASPRSTPTPTLTYRFLDDVLGELAALTPGAVPAHRRRRGAQHRRARTTWRSWRACSRSWRAHGKRVAGWEEIASAPLAPGSLVQYWNTMGRARARPRARRRRAGRAARHVAGRPRLPRHEVRRVDAARARLGRARRGARQLRLGSGDAASTGVGEDDDRGRRGGRVDRDAAHAARTSRRCSSRGCAPSPRWRGRRRRGATGTTSARGSRREAPRWDAAGVAYTRSPQVWPA